MQLIPTATKYGGTADDPFLESMSQLPVLEQRLTAIERALQRTSEVGELDRFGEVILGPALDAQGGAGRVVDRREHEDGEVGLDFQGQGHQVDSAGAGHPDVA